MQLSTEEDFLMEFMVVSWRHLVHIHRQSRILKDHQRQSEIQWLESALVRNQVLFVSALARLKAGLLCRDLFAGWHQWRQCAHRCMQQCQKKRVCLLWTVFTAWTRFPFLFMDRELQNDGSLKVAQILMKRYDILLLLRVFSCWWKLWPELAKEAEVEQLRTLRQEVLQYIVRQESTTKKAVEVLARGHSISLKQDILVVWRSALDCQAQCLPKVLPQNPSGITVLPFAIHEPHAGHQAKVWGQHQTGLTQLPYAVHQPRSWGDHLPTARTLSTSSSISPRSEIGSREGDSAQSSAR